MTKEDMKGAWGVVFTADDKVKAAEQALKAAIRERSNALKDIAEANGKGPYSVRGQIMSIKRRVNKAEGYETYFLVGKSDSDITVVE